MFPKNVEIRPFLDFSRPEFPVMDEAMGSDGALAWDGILGSDWVLA